MTTDNITSADELASLLSTDWGIDPQADWVAKHNAEAQRVVDAYEAGSPIRVPLRHADYAHMHGFYADEIDLDYRDYMNDPAVMVRVQLEAARRRRELPIYDSPDLGKLPDSWELTVDLHPVIPFGWVGCEVVYRRDCVPAHLPMRLSREECRDMPMPDAKTGNLMAHFSAMKEGMESYVGKLEFLGRPIGPVSANVTHHGLFSIAMNIRGEEIMSDMYEDPGFVHEFFQRLAHWWQELNVVWYGEKARNWPMEFSDHGIEMLSADTYEKFVVRAINEYNSKLGVSPGKGLHHCGHGTHLFPLMVENFDMNGIGALTYPLVDIAKVRRDMGPDVELTAGIGEEILLARDPGMIRRTVKELLGSGVMEGPGKFQLSMGDMLRGIPLARYDVLYESIKEFGEY